MNSPNRRKACQLEIEKQAYLRHLNRLEELKSGKSPEQLRRNRDQKKLVQAIQTVRKMHTYNREFKQKQMKYVEEETTKGPDFDKVKSVVTNDFNWPIPTIAPKHKRNQRPIHDQNIKMFQRIIQAKSNVISRNNMYTQRKKQRKNKQPLPCISTIDFSKLYQTSQMYEQNNKKIKLKLGKSKRYMKFKLKIDYCELFDIIKDVQATYIIQVYFGDFKAKSQAFILGQLRMTTVIVKIGENQVKGGRIMVKFMRILDYYQKKQVCKARLHADISQQLLKDKQNQPVHRHNTEQTSPNQNKQNKIGNRIGGHKQKRVSRTMTIELSIQKQKHGLSIANSKVSKNKLKDQQKQKQKHIL